MKREAIAIEVNGLFKRLTQVRPHESGVVRTGVSYMAGGWVMVIESK